MYATLLWTSLRFPKIDKPLVVYRFYYMALFHSQTRRHMININKKASEYGQEIPQKHSADQPMAPQEKATEHCQSQDIRNTILVKKQAFSSPSR